MSRWRRLEIDALIDASGVRRSCDTACSSAARSVLAAARSAARTGLDLQALALVGGGQLGGEGVRAPARRRPTS